MDEQETNKRRLRIAKPKRPLSAFNLFYRYKRQKVLQAIADGQYEKEDIAALVEAAPGLEGHPRATEEEYYSKSDVEDLRREKICKDLENNLLPRDTRDRTHRTNQSAMNGAMSFIELGRLMNASWKKCDEFSKKVFNELSEEGRDYYRKRLKEYNAAIKVALAKEDEADDKSTEFPKKKKSSKKKSSQPDRGSEENDPSSDDRGLSRKRTFDGHATHGRKSGPDSLRTVSKDHDTEPSRGQGHSNGSEHHVSLLQRVRELEGQLATERLVGRVRELESMIGRQQTVEENLRSQLHIFSRGGGHPPSQPPMSRGPSGMREEGLWSLASASMIHPSVQAEAERAEQRAAMYSRMMAGRGHPAPPMQHPMYFHHPYAQEVALAAHRRRMDVSATTSDNSPTKRPRHH
eukprot:CAMPEP_0183717810 /NCGR_PEP_ID=MMETSP0737-20130205/11284_1 /TAXON_ID=385413 /ORGANISM="Thalassiosira miniscula, Strain CCMP1093" /LENGTH=404 /DNA_ID=CAMNT_0025947287 /DNA_START=240 /DNA_END=1454 /DNA_ORIENTATION=-